MDFKQHRSGFIHAKKVLPQNCGFHQTNVKSCKKMDIKIYMSVLANCIPGVILGLSLIPSCIESGVHYELQSTSDAQMHGLVTLNMALVPHHCSRHMFLVICLLLFRVSSNIKHHYCTPTGSGFAESEASKKKQRSKNNKHH